LPPPPTIFLLLFSLERPRPPPRSPLFPRLCYRPASPRLRFSQRPGLSFHPFLRRQPPLFPPLAMVLSLLPPRRFRRPRRLLSPPLPPLRFLSGSLAPRRRTLFRPRRPRHSSRPRPLPPIVFCPPRLFQRLWRPQPPTLRHRRPFWRPQPRLPLVFLISLRLRLPWRPLSFRLPITPGPCIFTRARIRALFPCRRCFPCFPRPLLPQRPLPPWLPRYRRLLRRPPSPSWVPRLP
jgi:hypothetical protein